MKALHYTAAIVWAIFWIYWLITALRSKPNLNRGFALRSRVPLAAAIIVVRLWHPRGLEIHSVVVGALGMAIILCGLAIAVWARVYLGNNWGMPMTTKQDPELVTTGPYSRVRHPIYSGLLLALVGTVLITNVVTVVIVIGFIGTFAHSAIVEERNMTSAFPETYPDYRARTKMMVPFLL